MLGKLRRGRLSDRPSRPSNDRETALAVPSAGAGWDYTAQPELDTEEADDHAPGLRAQVLSLFADPRVHWLTTEDIVRLVGQARQDVETTIDAMIQSGELHVEGHHSVRRVRMGDAEKHQLESMFRDAARDLGETSALMQRDDDDIVPQVEDETEEPRLPVTAGLLSLFLPGTGQLLNGDVGRASLVFAVWSLAWITHLSPVWTFVCLYAGAEAFFTAKIRAMERKLQKEALPEGNNGLPPQLPPPKPSSP